MLGENLGGDGTGRVPEPAKAGAQTGEQAQQDEHDGIAQDFHDR